MQMYDSEYDELDETAKTVAARYRQLCAWADFDDLYQEAWVAIALASRSFDPAYGTPFAGYCIRSGYRYTRTFLWKSSSPVSAGRNNLEKLKGLTATSTDVLNTDGFAVTPGADEASMTRDKTVATIDAVAALALDGLDLDYRTLIDLITGDLTAKEVAASSGRSVKHINALVRGAKDALYCSPELLQIWRDK